MKREKRNDYFISNSFSRIPSWIVSLRSNHPSKRYGEKEKERNALELAEIEMLKRCYANALSQIGRKASEK